MKRYDAYCSALDVFETSGAQDLSNEFIQSGIVGKFSLQFELGWKMLKDLLRYEGDSAAASGSPRSILKAAYKYFDFIDEQVWLAMMQDRNTISHTYDAESMRQLIARILKTYIPSFVQVRDAVAVQYEDELDAIA